MERSASARRPTPLSPPPAASAPIISPAARALLSAGLQDLDLDPPSAVVEALLGLAAHLERWAQRLNLTAHVGQVAIVHRLILDAAALGTVLPQAERVADIGSGAGFPGIPLALLWPHARVTSIDARERRIHYQRSALRELGISNVSSQHGRAEILDPTPHDLVLAQALAPPERALPLLVPWVAAGGIVALPGAERVPLVSTHPEIEPQPPLSYQVPCGGPRRTLWLGRRRS